MTCFAAYETVDLICRNNVLLGGKVRKLHRFVFYGPGVRRPLRHSVDVTDCPIELVAVSE